MIGVRTISAGKRIYPTWNPDDKGAAMTLSNGNLTAVVSGGQAAVRATQAKSAGRWYWESTLNLSGTGRIGIASATFSITNVPGEDPYSWVVKGNGAAVTNGSTVFTLASFNIGDILGLALDCDNHTLTAYINNSNVGTFTSLPSSTAFYPVAGTQSNLDINTRFGPTLTYSPPSGFSPGFYS